MEETMKRVTILILSVILLMLLIAGSVLAGTADGGSGITLSYPDNMIDCEPTFHISTTGVPDDWTIKYNVFMATPSGSLTKIGGSEIPVAGNLDVTFSGPELEPGNKGVYAVFAAVFNSDGILKTKLRGKWTAKCVEIPPPDS